MKKIQKVLVSIICGFATFSIIPGCDYSQFYTKSASEMMNKSWVRTGENLSGAARKVVKSYEKCF